MKFVVFIFCFFIFLGATCSKQVKEEVKGLQSLKTECDNLQIELESLQAKKFTKVIDEKIKQCSDHGFWERKRPKIKDFTEGL